MDKYKVLISILILSSISLCDGCTVFNFESDYNETFTTDGYCTNFGGTWKQEVYTDSMDKFHPDSTMYIAPSVDSLSCLNTLNFPMSTNGVVEINLYVGSTAPVLLQVNVVEEDGINMVGFFFSSSNFDSGWNTISINLSGSGDFTGYITLIGQNSNTAPYLIDSIRYVPPLYEDICEIYENVNQTTTEELTDTTTTSNNGVTDTTTDSGITDTTTTSDNVVTDTTTTSDNSVTDTTTTSDNGVTDTTTEDGLTLNCFSYNFGDDYNVMFTSDGICTAFTRWEQREYTSDMERFHPSSTTYIAPSVDSLSCVNTFQFAMSSGGVVEINLYVESRVQSHLQFNAYRDNGIVIVGSFTANESNVVTGWNTITITLSGDALYMGYITFVGQSSNGASYLVDSIRYIPPIYTTA